MNGDFLAKAEEVLVTYFNTGLEKHVEFKCLCVAVNSKHEQTSKNVQDAAKAIEICGFQAHWLTYEHKGDRQHFIMGKALDDGTYQSLDKNLAEKIADMINKIAVIAWLAPSQYKE